MTQLRFINDLGVILVQVTFWVCVVFIISTSIFWPWWKTDLGWTIILKTACLGAILLPPNLTLIFGINTTSFFWRWESVATFAGIAMTIIWRGIVIWLLQRRDPPPMKSAYHHAEGS